jgi:hypothetical protein
VTPSAAKGSKRVAGSNAKQEPPLLTMRKRSRAKAADGSATPTGGSAATKTRSRLLLEEAWRQNQISLGGSGGSGGDSTRSIGTKPRRSPRPPRGHLMLTALSAGVPLQSSLDHLFAVSADRWSTLTEAFGTMNPRSFIPFSSTLSLLGALGKTSAVKAFRSWSDRVARHADDEERYRRMSDALSSLLRGDYVWIPALAWLLERLSWEAIYELTIEAFGPNHAACTANTNYIHVEAAILRENLLRHHARLEETWLHAFESPGSGNGSEGAEEAPRLAILVLRIARIYLVDRFESWKKVLAQRGGSEGDLRVHRSSLQELPIALRARAILRTPSPCPYRG